MAACTSFLAFFAEQMLAFAGKMHSRPGRWPLEAAKRLEARAHAVRSAGTLGRLRRGARRPRAVSETGRCRRSPEGVKGRGQREALRSPGIPGQRSARRYEDSKEAGRAASALCAHRRPEGLEWRAHGAKRSAQPRNTGPLKAARCEDAGRPLRIVDSLLPRPPPPIKSSIDNGRI